MDISGTLTVCPPPLSFSLLSSSTCSEFLLFRHPVLILLAGRLVLDGVFGVFASMMDSLVPVWKQKNKRQTKKCCRPRPEL